MPIYKVRRGSESYGHAIGIMLVDCSTPFIPGDVGNASTYKYPVVYRTIPGVTLTRLIDQADKTLTSAVVKTALDLEAMGVRAVSSDCGYMIHFQAEVAAALSIPAILSSLLQLPMIERAIGPKAKIGVLCANDARLTPEMLALAGLSDPGRAVVRGLQGSKAFRSPILDEEPLLDREAVEADMVAAAESLVSSNPEIGPILLECSNMPPYAHAVQKATGRPVFDFTTLIDAFCAAGLRRPFEGFY